MKSSTQEPLSSGARERIVLTASRLFYREGVRATGIDKIIAESGVAKMSFYRHFPSKNNLITEFLVQRHCAWMEWFTAAVESRLLPTGTGIEVIADVLQSWFEEPDFRGCAFINTLAETPMAEAEPNQITLIHKVALEAYLADLLAKLGNPTSKEAAAAAMIVIEGTIVRAQMTGDPGVTEVCKGLLRRISRQAFKKPEAEPDVMPQQEPYLPGFA